ncbi:Putative protein of unknown function [Podospora comata]|uniref:Uncharacterized protein n=1 Tax=Podospora comata TaxID=48703 RepID=A0ABY6RTQ5_PODCO|nr:Putative protein of unknown function [Podospora comata]
MGDAWHFNSAIHTVRRWDGGGTLALQVW